MDVKRIGRLLLAFGLAGVAAFAAWSYVTMPYTLVTTTSTSTRAQPDGAGVFALAFIFAALAIVAAFSGDWE
ncbi:MAG TPA: hypothetical protein VMT30_09265 [Candidatus Saccharimonadia bacterium]|nr:hypothetical protein [Candidatus Saccharimonadia bacterium]